MTVMEMVKEMKRSCFHVKKTLLRMSVERHHFAFLPALGRQLEFPHVVALITPHRHLIPVILLILKKQ